jgi:hypothetical protein
MSEAVIHSETQVFPFKNAIIIAVFLCFALIPVFLKLPWWMIVGILLIGILSAALIHSVMILKVELTQTALEFGYWFSSPKISLTEIIEPEVVEIPKLAGIGMHYYKKYFIYNARFGRGIQFSTPKRKYMIGSDRPDQLLSTLNSVLPRTKSL